MRTRLYTRDGGFVEELALPPFQLMPEIVVWGQRHFVRNMFMDTTDSYGYAEAFAYYSVPAMEMGKVSVGAAS